MPIRDQRTMQGVATKQRARSRWASYHADRQTGAPLPFPNRDSVELLDAGGTVVAYVNENRWVADCPECRGGIAVAEEWVDCCCLDCGRVYAAELPAPALIRRAERVLELRGEERLMNWYPSRESVDDLKAENAVRGVPFA